MRVIVYFLAGIFLLVNAGDSFAKMNDDLNKNQGKEVIKEFKVYGNCAMCEDRIEKAALSVNGVKKAEWNKKTKIMKVTFDEDIVNLDQIHIAIAKVGHDTDLVKATQKVYNKLHGCCKYR